MAYNMAYTESARRSSSPLQTQRSASPIQSHRAPVYTYAQPTTQQVTQYASSVPMKAAGTFASQPVPAAQYYAAQPEAIQGLQSTSYRMASTAATIAPSIISGSPVAPTLASSSVGFPAATTMTYTSPGVPGFAASLSAPVFASMNQGFATEILQSSSQVAESVQFISNGAVGIAPQATSMQAFVSGPLSEDRIRRAAPVYKGGSLAAPAGGPVFVEREVPALVVVQEPVFVEETVVVQEPYGMVQETIIVQEPAVVAQETIIVQEPVAFVEETVAPEQSKLQARLAGAGFVEEAVIVQEPEAIFVQEQGVEEVLVQGEAQQLPFLESAECMQNLDFFIQGGSLEAIVRVCILGGKKFNDEATKTLVQALARDFDYLKEQVVILTGGMPGVQETFAQSCPCESIHLLPQGEASNFGVGQDYPAFLDLDERIEVFGAVGQIYIAVEGGPGVAKEANAAFARGAIVIPLISTGGASGGMFDFPAGALEQPDYASPEQWDLLSVKGRPDETARAVVEMILQLLPQPQFPDDVSEN